MDVSSFDKLLTALGQSALTEAVALSPTEATYPSCFDRLAKRFPAALCRAALDTVLLREKARRKFHRADSMYFTREALEMATSETVAAYRAQRFTGYREVSDLCSGIGGDSIGLGSAGLAVVAVDSDPLHSAMGRANTAGHGLDVRHECVDVLGDRLPLRDAAFADPGRRAGGHRVLSLADTVPPVAAILGRHPAGHPIGVKVAPGVPKADVERLDAEAEFISLGGELKECVLWFGDLKRTRFSVTVLPGPARLVADDVPVAPPVSPPRAYFYDPDPAVVRSGLLPVLAGQIGAERIDADIAYLTSDALTLTPFATAYRVFETLPFNAKTIGAALRAGNVGRVTMLKRGSPVDVNELRSRWKLTGSLHRAVVITRAAGRPVAIIAERVG